MFTLYSICSMPCWINKSNLVCAHKGCSLVSVIWICSWGHRICLHREKRIPELELETTWLLWVVGGDFETKTRLEL